jgi:Zn-dependent metalloprotease
MNASSHARNPVQCIVPPYMLERLAQSSNDDVRLAAIENLQQSATLRGKRSIIGTLPSAVLKFAAFNPTGKPKRVREVYDQGNVDPPDRSLPERLVRAEGGKASRDKAVDEAYVYSGKTWDFYRDAFGRNSLDDQGLKLVSTVHAGNGYDNAFWDGMQMVYGDGDGIVFQRFTRSLDVVGHELSHGVVQHTSGLIYAGESGALNEHFADVFGSLVRQYASKQTAVSADWLIGKAILVPAPTRNALRSLKDPGTAFADDPDLGDDPQPKHYAKRYKGGQDNGGVHINSGIPNHAFYLAAVAVGGKAWEKVGRVWYQVMQNLLPQSNFADCAAQARAVAGSMFPGDATLAKAVDDAWKQVGL